MTNFLLQLTLLAQDAPAKPQQQPGLWEQIAQFTPFLLIGVIFYALLIRPQARERAKHQELLAALKKNDRVVTIGGIVGTIASVNADVNEIVLKVDDSTRLRVRRDAIREVLTKTDKPAT